MPVHTQRPVHLGCVAVIVGPWVCSLSGRESQGLVHHGGGSPSLCLLAWQALALGPVRVLLSTLKLWTAEEGILYPFNGLLTHITCLSEFCWWADPRHVNTRVKFGKTCRSEIFLSTSLQRMEPNHKICSKRIAAFPNSKGHSPQSFPFNSDGERLLVSSCWTPADTGQGWASNQPNSYVSNPMTHRLFIIKVTQGEVLCPLRSYLMWCHWSFCRHVHTTERYCRMKINRQHLSCSKRAALVIVHIWIINNKDVSWFFSSKAEWCWAFGSPSDTGQYRQYQNQKQLYCHFSHMRNLCWWLWSIHQINQNTI